VEGGKSGSIAELERGSTEALVLKNWHVQSIDNLLLQGKQNWSSEKSQGNVQERRKSQWYEGSRTKILSKYPKSTTPRRACGSGH